MGMRTIIKALSILYDHTISILLIMTCAAILCIVFTSNRHNYYTNIHSHNSISVLVNTDYKLDIHNNGVLNNGDLQFMKNINNNNKRTPPPPPPSLLGTSLVYEKQRRPPEDEAVRIRMSNRETMPTSTAQLNNNKYYHWNEPMFLQRLLHDMFPSS